MSRQSRAVFLPSPIDPYVLLHCLWFFENIWQDEVDKLYIHLNSDIERPVAYALIELLKTNSKITVIYSDHITNHGTAIDTMLSQCYEDNILLIEDDSAIFKKGVVDYHFNLLETDQYDVLGSPRGSCSQNWANIAKDKFSLDYSGFGDKGPNYWPCFLWAKRRCLLATDRDFNAKTFQKGENFLGTILEELACGDTFAWTSVQLRTLGFRIKEIKQYHCNPQDKAFYKPRRLGIFDGKCGYIHFGSLSSGISGYLIDENNKHLKDRLKSYAQPEVRNTKIDMDVGEIQTRLALWNEGYRIGTKMGYYCEGFSEAYKYALEYLQKRAELTDDDWKQWIQLYKHEVMGIYE